MNQLQGTLREERCKLYAPVRTEIILDPAREEVAVVYAGAGSPRRVLYHDVAGEEGLPAGHFKLVRGEQAFVFTRDFSVTLEQPVRLREGLPAEVAAGVSVRLLCPRDRLETDPHPFLSELALEQPGDGSQFRRVVGEALARRFEAPVAEYFNDKDYEKQEWSEAALEAALLPLNGRLQTHAQLNVRKFTLVRVSSAPGEEMKRQFQQIAQLVREAKTKQEASARLAEIHREEHLREEEARFWQESLAREYDHKRELQELLHRGELAKATAEVRRASEASQAALAKAGFNSAKVETGLRLMKLREETEAAELTARRLRAEAETRQAGLAAGLAQEQERKSRLELETAELAREKARLEVEAAQKTDTAAALELRQVKERLEAHQQTQQLLDESIQSSLRQIAGYAEVIQKMMAAPAVRVPGPGLALSAAERLLRCNWVCCGPMAGRWDPAHLQVRSACLMSFDSVVAGEALRLELQSERDGFFYVLSLGPYCRDGELRYAWNRLYSNRNQNDLKYEFRRAAGNFLRRGEVLELPAGGESASARQGAWILNEQPGRELLYVLFSQAPLEDSVLAQAMAPVPGRRFSARGFEPSAGQTVEPASWQLGTEDFRGPTLANFRRVLPPEVQVEEFVFTHT